MTQSLHCVSQSWKRYTAAHMKVTEGLLKGTSFFEKKGEETKNALRQKTLTSKIYKTLLKIFC